MVKISQSFYLNTDVEFIARSVLGKYLYCNIEGMLCGGIITETEAYKGIEDKASHAYNGKRTERTQVMYEKGGIAYVYLCYGIHYLLNIVTADYNIPHAVLIRGIYPMIGIDYMLQRTNKNKSNYNLTNGPGKLSKALGITKELNGASYNGDDIWLEDEDLIIKPEDITSGPRIGVDYAKEDASLPYRYILNYKNYIKKTP